MKAVAFFVLFVTVKCFLSLDQTRNRIHLSAKEIWKIIENLSLHEGLYEEIGSHFSGGYNHRILKRTVKSNVSDAYSLLTEMNDILAHASYYFILDNMKKYCLLVDKIISETQVSEINQTTLDLIKLRDEQNYCALRFIFDIEGYDVEPIFKIMHTLHTLPDVEFTLLPLRRLINEFLQHNLGSDVSSSNYLRQNSLRTPARKTYALLQIKHSLAEFSNIFCSATIPLFTKGLLNNLVIVETPVIKSRFTEYFLGFERCKVNFSTDPSMMPSQRDHIIDWNCEMILGSLEYGYNEYETKVTQSLGVFGNFQKLTSKIKNFQKTPEESSDVSSDKSVNYENDPRTKATRGQKYSLIALKHHLKSNNYYMNIVQYYNIALEVIVLVSIKEGKKMLKGIKLMLGTNFPRYCTISGIEKLRLKLFFFKTIFSNLTTELERKIKFIQRYNHHKQAFLTLVNTILKLLETSQETTYTYDAMLENCDGVVNILLQVVGDALLGDHPDYAIPEFISYYFDQPIFFIRTLYTYSKKILKQTDE